MDFKTALVAKGQKAGLSFTQAQVEEFNTYCQMLLETNKVMNLTAITEPEEVAVKHMIDSLLVYNQVGFAGKTLADVGTGAGFPGIPLKLYDKTIHLTLIDSLAKRLTFLENVLKALNITDVTLVHSRAEDAGQNPALREKFQIVTARAVANLPVLAEYCLPLTAVGGKFYALKGHKFQEEVQEGQRAVKILGGQIEEVREVRLPDLEDTRAIIVIKKFKATDKKYPRKAGTASKKPL